MIDFNQVQQDLKALVIASAVGPGNAGPQTFANVFVEAMERELIVDNCPICNIKLSEALHEPTDLPGGYYIHVIFEVDVMTFDFTEYANAATLRDQLLQATMNVIRKMSNRNWSSGMNTSKVAPQTRFGKGTSKDGNGHVALATFNVIAEFYADAIP